MKPHFFKMVLVAIWAALPAKIPAQSYYFSTLAGSVENAGTVNGANNAARLTYPTGMAVDTDGTVYFADRSTGHAIRKLTHEGTNWVVTTIAGGANTSFQPRDGTNTYALFYTPSSVALDKAGNLYVADTYNHAIRRMVRDGTNWITTTIAGMTNSPPFGSTADGTNRSATFNQPVRLVVDSATNIFVADYWSRVIRKIRPEGTNWITTTIAGKKATQGNQDGTNDTALFMSPNGTALDSAGNLYVTDSGNGSVRKLTPEGTNWVVTTIATGFVIPACIVADKFDNLFIADNGHHQIKRLTQVGTNWVVTVVGGSGVEGSADGINGAAQFKNPDGVAVDAEGHLYIGDSGNRTLRLGTPFPTLELSLVGGQSILSWGTWPTNFILEKTDDLSSPVSWSEVTVPVLLTNDQKNVTLPMEQERQFFRLRPF